MVECNARYPLLLACPSWPFVCQMTMTTACVCISSYAYPADDHADGGVGAGVGEGETRSGQQHQLTPSFLHHHIIMRPTHNTTQHSSSKQAMLRGLALPGRSDVGPCLRTAGMWTSAGVGCVHVQEPAPPPLASPHHPITHQQQHSVACAPCDKADEAGTGTCKSFWRRP